MSTAVDMFLNQVVLVGGIPFSVTVPKPPADIDATQMTEAQLHAKLQRGYDDYKAEYEVSGTNKIFIVILNNTEERLLIEAFGKMDFEDRKRLLTYAQNMIRE